MELDKKLEEEYKEIKAENVFSKNELDRFFNNPIWDEVLKMIEMRKSMLMGIILNPMTTREEDLTRKGQYVEALFWSGMQSILLKEETDEGLH